MLRQKLPGASKCVFECTMLHCKVKCNKCASLQDGSLAGPWDAWVGSPLIGSFMASIPLSPQQHSPSDLMEAGRAVIEKC
eukprot:3625877-Amphidinium_carterae.2